MNKDSIVWTLSCSIMLAAYIGLFVVNVELHKQKNLLEDQINSTIVEEQSFLVRLPAVDATGKETFEEKDVTVPVVVTSKLEKLQPFKKYFRKVENE